MRERPTTKSVISWMLGSAICFLAFAIFMLMNRNSKYPIPPEFVRIMIPWMAACGVLTGYAMAWHILAEENDAEQEESDRCSEELPSK